MIRASHGTNQYAKPSFCEVPNQLGFQQALTHLLRMASRGSAEELTLGDSGHPPVHEFARRFEQVRNLLVARKLRGEKLSAEEDLVLEEINSALWSTMEPPKQESERVRLAVEEAKLILRSIGDGKT